MKAIKILVTGPFNAGKTTLIKTLCGKILQTDKQLRSKTLKETTTVALDFGILKLNKERIRLFGTPGQRRFSFMWKILASGMDGYILMVDAQDWWSVKEAAYIYRFFKIWFPNTPHVISANKVDGEKVLSENTIREALDVPPDVPICPTVALDHSSALNLVNLLLNLIKKRGKK